MKQLNLFDPAPIASAQKQGDALAVLCADAVPEGEVETGFLAGDRVRTDQGPAATLVQQSEGAHAEGVQKKEQKKKGGCAIHWKLFVDGAARNNPGPAGAGFYLLKDSAFFAKKGYYLGSRTNNQAEYAAFLLGLYFLKDHVKPGDCVHIVSDSQLLVRQLQGLYKIKAPELRPLYALAHALMTMVHAQIFHVLRTDNAQADRMANKGIDNKRDIPEGFVKMLHAHGISW